MVLLLGLYAIQVLKLLELVLTYLRERPHRMCKSSSSRWAKLAKPIEQGALLV